MSASQSTFRQMWATRPPRIPPKSYDEGSLFGVCRGIAARYPVNIYLIRILFLILFFVSTGGFFLYVLCVLLMPKIGRASAPIDAIRKPKGPLTPEEKDDRTIGWLAVAVLVNYVFAVTLGLGVGYTLAALGCVFIFLTGWWLVHQRYPEPPSGLPMPHAGMHSGMPGPYPGAPSGYGPPNGFGTPGHYPPAQPGPAHNPYGSAHPGYAAGTGHSHHAPHSSRATFNPGSKSSGRKRSKYVTIGEKKPEDPQLLFTRLGIALGVISILGVTVSFVFRIFG